MTFAPVHRADVLIGHELRLGDVLFFFGTAAGTRADLVAAYPQLEFCGIKQIHGRHVVTADPAVARDADGHVTTRERRAPIVITADCVPILLASRDRVCAIHAGWRGIEADIVGAGLARFTEADPVRFAAIGPHLGFASFEVGLDVADRLTTAATAVSTQPASAFRRPHALATKTYFDLTAVARALIARATGARLLEFTPDTLTDPTYHSYRRAPERGGRNLSFVVRNP